MKKFLLSLLMLSAFFGIFAVKTGGDSDYSPDGEGTHYPAMILVEDGENVENTIADLEALGVIVLRHRQNILLTYIPKDATLEMKRKKTRGVKTIHYSRPRHNTPTMSQARYFNNANLIYEGASLPQPFDGKGVVVGVCDIGFDARHPNFLDSLGNECRIRKVVHYEEDMGKRTVYTTPQEIYDWETDNPDDYHATHVTGIAAGAHTKSGYHSLAPSAEIVFTASQLSDVGLLAGVEDIIEYAREVEKPVVINLSMGNYLGPHDGTSLFTRYLDMCAEDAIICISAGNEGNSDIPVSTSIDFTASRTAVDVQTAEWGGIDYTGLVEIWSKDSNPFDFSFFWRSSNFEHIRDYEPMVFSPETITEWRVSADKEDPDYDENFNKICKEGYVYATGGISPLNGRYYVSMQFEIKSDIHAYDKDKEQYVDWAEYWAAVRLGGEPGQHVDVQCTGGSFLRGVTGSPGPNSLTCISDLATGKKTISVGSMNNTDVGDISKPRHKKGEISYFTSFGTLIDGRVMPVTVAPGAYMYSSTSSPFLEKHPEEIKYTDYNTDFNGKTVYWIGDLGTSMSSPFVASAIATWLQAYPLLTSEDAQNIIIATNQKEGYPDPSNGRHGQGWFNAYQGLQKVLDLAALNVVSVEDSNIAIKFTGNGVIVGNPSALPQTLEVYNTAGMLAYRKTVADTLETVPLDHLPGGVYIVRVGNQSIKVIMK